MDNFKLDTKEKFNVITPNISLLADITAETLYHFLEEQLKKPTKNVIINMEEVKEIDSKTAERLGEMALLYLETNASFVLCSIAPSVKSKLDGLDMVDILNITPTESEAWDIVQMEEIERELFSEGE